MKTCKGCGAIKPLDDFYVNRTKLCRYKNNHRHSNFCKECDKLKCKLRFRTIRYGITLEEYLAQMAKRDNKCDICHEQFDTLCCDHDHKTYNNRGLLCQKCNKLLGHALDNQDILLSAIEYLKEYA